MSDLKDINDIPSLEEGAEPPTVVVDQAKVLGEQMPLRLGRGGGYVILSFAQEVKGLTFTSHQARSLARLLSVHADLCEEEAGTLNLVCPKCGKSLPFVPRKGKPCTHCGLVISLPAEVLK